MQLKYLSFDRRSVNDFACPVKGKVHCRSATLDMGKKRASILSVKAVCSPLVERQIKIYLKGVMNNENSSDLCEVQFRTTDGTVH